MQEQTGMTRRCPPNHPATVCLSSVPAAVLLFGLSLAAVEIRIVSEPGEATAYLDGRFVGVTPVAVERVEKGRHLLELSKYRHRPWKDAVAVVEDGQELRAILSPLGGEVLRVVSKPAGATVFLDGVPRGRTPAALVDIAAGTYSVQLQLDEWLPWQTAVAVQEGRETSVDAVLQFKGEEMLLQEIAALPHKIVNYYELAHQYALQQEYDKVMDTFARGFDACVHPDAETDGSRRLYQEVDRVYTGQYDFAATDIIEALRPKLIELCRQAITRVPRNVSNYWALGQMLGREGKWEEAVAVYESGLKVMKTCRGKMHYECLAAGAMYQIGWRLERQKAYPEALARYEALVKAYPKPWHAANALRRIAHIHQSILKDPGRAVDAYRRLIRGHPEDDSCPSVQLTIAGMLRRDLKDYAGAIEEYRTFVQRYPADDRCPEALLGSAEILRADLEQPGKAVKEYRELIANYPRSDLCADALRGIGLADAQLSARMYRDVVDKYPCSAAADAVDTDKARVAARKQARAMLKAAEALERKTTALHGQGVRFARLAARLRTSDAQKSKQYRERADAARKGAREAGEKLLADGAAIVKKFPTFHHAREAQRFIIAMLETIFQDPQAAIEARREFIRLFPDDDSCPKVRYDIGNAYFTQLKEHEKAVAELKSLIADHPESDQCVQAQVLIARIYSHDYGHYNQERQVEENQRLIANYPGFDGNAAAQSAIARNFHYRVEPGDDERAAAEYLKIVRDYPYSSNAAATEYPLDQHGAGLQLAELEAEARVGLDKVTGRRITQPAP